MRVFEFLDRRGGGVYSEWYEALQKPQRAALDAKLDTVRAAGEMPTQGRGDLPPNLFRGPVSYRGRFYRNTWKLTATAGNVVLRPLACKGPMDIQNEWTILVPCIEVGGKYPDGVFAEAEARRLELISDPSRRRELRGDDD